MSKRFVVDLGNVEMDNNSAERVEVAIQKAALGALAEIDFHGDLIARFPREWWGIWIDIGKGLPINDKPNIEFAKK